MKLYQVHEHSKSCIKYENKSCRYGFGKFLQKDQLSPLEDNIKDIEQFSIIIKTRNVLSKVNAFMNTFFHPSNDTSMKDLSIDSVLLELQITKNDYY